MTRIASHRVSPGHGVLVALVVLFFTTPLVADTVYLKNGSKIETREPYRVEGDQAVLVLTNGTVSKIPLADIDAERTTAANRPGFSSAQIIEGGESRPLERTPAASRRRQTQSLQDVAAERDLRARQRSEATVAPEAPNPAATRLPLADADLRRYLSRVYASQEFTPELFEGTGPGTAIVRLTTDSEGAVFRGLVSTAVALLDSSENLAQALSVLELEMHSSDGGEAGDFRVTRDRAEALRSRQITPQDFYVRYVEF